MTGAAFNARVAAVYRKATQRYAVSFNHYRPTTTASSPIVSGTLLGLRLAQFTMRGNSNVDFTKQDEHKSQLFTALIDPVGVLRGDYFVHTTLGTFFIADIAEPMPALAVQCNRTVTVFDQGPQNAQVGVSGYGGTVAATNANTVAGTANENAVLSSWPASVLISGQTREKNLPSDAGSGVWRVLLPPTPQAVRIRPGSVITDDLNNRFTVMQAELQDMGWRINAQQEIV